MMNQYPWAMGLKIPNDTIAAWEMQAAGSDLLRWALANGKLPEFGYQEWAKSYYQLPSLDTQFFDQPPSPELWAKWGSFAWAGTFLPIYEWEGTLYIACLEPPNFEQSQVIEQLNTRVGLLIAPMSGMKKWWSILSPVTQAAPQAPSSNLPPGLAAYASGAAGAGQQAPVQSGGQQIQQTATPNFNGNQNPQQAAVQNHQNFASNQAPVANQNIQGQQAVPSNAGSTPVQPAQQNVQSVPVQSFFCTNSSATSWRKSCESECSCE